MVKAGNVILDVVDDYVSISYVVAVEGGVEAVTVATVQDDSRIKLKDIVADSVVLPALQVPIAIAK